MRSTKRARRQGYLPCFSCYRFDRYPIEELYRNNVYVEKVKRLLSCALDIQSPSELCTKYDVGRAIQPIRPTDLELSIPF